MQQPQAYRYAIFIDPTLLAGLNSCSAYCTYQEYRFSIVHTTLSMCSPNEPLSMFSIADVDDDKACDSEERGENYEQGMLVF